MLHNDNNSMIVRNSYQKNVPDSKHLETQYVNFHKNNEYHHSLQNNLEIHHHDTNFHNSNKQNTVVTLTSNRQNNFDVSHPALPTTHYLDASSNTIPLKPHTLHKNISQQNQFENTIPDINHQHHLNSPVIEISSSQNHYEHLINTSLPPLSNETSELLCTLPAQHHYDAKEQQQQQQQKKQTNSYTILHNDTEEQKQKKHHHQYLPQSGQNMVYSNQSSLPSQHDYHPTKGSNNLYSAYCTQPNYHISIPSHSSNLQQQYDHQNNQYPTGQINYTTHRYSSFQPSMVSQIHPRMATKSNSSNVYSQYIPHGQETQKNSQQVTDHAHYLPLSSNTSSSFLKETAHSNILSYPNPYLQNEALGYSSQQYQQSLNPVYNYVTDYSGQCHVQPDLTDLTHLQNESTMKGCQDQDILVKVARNKNDIGSMDTIPEQSMFQAGIPTPFNQLSTCHSLEKSLALPNSSSNSATLINSPSDSLYLLSNSTYGKNKKKVIENDSSTNDVNKHDDEVQNNSNSNDVKNTPTSISTDNIQQNSLSSCLTSSELSQKNQQRDSSSQIDISTQMVSQSSTNNQSNASEFDRMMSNIGNTFSTKKPQPTPPQTPHRPFIRLPDPMDSAVSNLISPVDPISTSIFPTISSASANLSYTNQAFSALPSSLLLPSVNSSNFSFSNQVFTSTTDDQENEEMDDNINLKMSKEKQENSNKSKKRVKKGANQKVRKRKEQKLSSVKNGGDLILDESTNHNYLTEANMTNTTTAKTNNRHSSAAVPILLSHFRLQCSESYNSDVPTALEQSSSIVNEGNEQVNKDTAEYLPTASLNMDQIVLHHNQGSEQNDTFSSNEIEKSDSSSSAETEIKINPKGIIRPQYICACGKKFQRLCGFKSHIRVHEARNQQLIMTELGPVWYNSQGQEVKAADDECDIQHACEQCGKIFIRKHDLRRHIKIIHLQGKKKLNCPNCKTTFSRSDALYKHLKLKKCPTGER